MRFLHTADLHLGRSFPYEREEDRARGREDRFATFQNILKLAEERKIDYLFLVGDIFEQTMIRTEELDYVFSRLSEMPFKTLMLLGNHDYRLYEAIRTRAGERVYLFPQGEVAAIEDEEKEVVFHGVSWSRESYHQILQFERDALDEGKRHILLHHGNWTGGDGYFPVDANILHFFDYIALGHVHKPIMYENKLQMCGTPEPLDHTDRGKLGIIVGELEETLSTEYIPLARRLLRHKTVHVGGEDALREALKTLEEAIDDASSIYNFYITGHYDGIADAEIRRVLEKSHILYRLEWARDLPKIIDKLERIHEDDALGAFIRRAKAYEVDEAMRLEICDLGIRALLGDDYDS